MDEVLDGAGIVGRANDSIVELEALGYQVARVRMHPLDWETVVAYYLPRHRRQADEIARMLGHAVALDERARLGEPVAEWEAPHEAAG